MWIPNCCCRISLGPFAILGSKKVHTAGSISYSRITENGIESIQEVKDQIRVFNREIWEKNNLNRSMDKSLDKSLNRNNKPSAMGLNKRINRLENSVDCLNRF